MPSTLRRVICSVGPTAALVLAAGSLAAPAQAAAKPPPASQLKVVQRLDHQLIVQFAVPTAFYHPGAGSVVRLTGGRTPAASPSAGYAVPTDGTHQATTQPGLRASQVYTLAVWIRDHGVYSKRVSITTSTLKDTTKPEPVQYLTAQAGLGDGNGRVVLSWKNYDRDVDYVRIVRNTKPTLTGGTVINVPPGPQSYTDDKLPAPVKSDRGFTDAPLYYYLIQRDTSGNFSRSYTPTSIVVASRTLSGTYQGSDRQISAWGPFSITGVTHNIENKTGAAIAGNRFSFSVPPGVYTVCDQSNNSATDPQGATAFCWVVNSDGSTRTVQSPNTTGETVFPPTIDVFRGSYDAIRFTAGGS